MPASNGHSFNGHSLRRSSRVPANVPVRVTSMEPDSQFSEICETLVVSAHGCALRFPMKVDTGSTLRLQRRGGRQTTAYVVFCQPMGPDGLSFRLGAQLERPENFWGLESFPDDWKVIEMPAPAGQQALTRMPAKSVVVQQSQTPSQASREILEKIEEKLSEERLRGVFAQFVRPLQAEVAELREKLSANAKRNRFEVSLGSIPPELEEKLWERLRQDLGTRVLEQTREQSAEILGSTKTAIEQKVSTGMAEFRHRLAGELQAVEQRAKALSTELSGATQQQVRAGIEKIQRHALETGAHLEAHGGKLLSSLQGQLAESHEAHRREVEQIQAEAAKRASQLQTEVSDLGRSMAALNESVRRLELELDSHLERLAAEVVSGAKGQIESAVAVAVKDLQVRGGNEIEARLSEMSGHLRTIQNRIEDSFFGSVTVQGEDAVLSVAQRFEELARESTERWRVALAKDLNSVANALGQDLRRELEPEEGQS